MAKSGAIPLVLACALEVRYPPQEGYLSDTCAIPYENKAKRVREISPSAIQSRKGIARYGGYLALGPICVMMFLQGHASLLSLFSRAAKRGFKRGGLSAPNRAIWLRLRFVIRIANRKSLAI